MQKSMILKFFREEMRKEFITLSVPKRAGGWFSVYDTGVLRCWKQNPRKWLCMRAVLTTALVGIVVGHFFFTSHKNELDCHNPRQPEYGQAKSDKERDANPEKYWHEKPGTTRHRFYLTYYTTWVLIIQVIYMLLSLYVTYRVFVPVYESRALAPAAGTPEPKALKATNLLHAIGLACGTSLSVVFWVALAKPAIWLEGDMSRFVWYFNVHGTNMVIIWLDAVVLNLGWNPGLYLPGLIGGVAMFLIYVMWNCLFFLAMRPEPLKPTCQPYTYEFFNWKENLIKPFLVAAVITVPAGLLGTVVFAIYKRCRPIAQRILLFEHLAQIVPLS